MGLVVRLAEIEEAMRFIEHETGIPAVTTSAIILDVESIVGFDLDERERQIVGEWFARTGMCQDRLQ